MGTTRTHGAEELVVVEERDGSAVSVRNLTVHSVPTEEDALNLLFEAETNRSIASHTMNLKSSRSHFVLTIYLRRRVRNSAGDGEDEVLSKLHLVDLAGSERVERTGSQGVVLREASFINKSLSFLEQVVVALAEANEHRRDHVPYRRSKLTHLLKDCLGGNCCTTLIACIWPASEHLEQTVGTLKFATRMRCVENSPVINSAKVSPPFCGHTRSLWAGPHACQRPLRAR